VLFLASPDPDKRRRELGTGGGEGIEGEKRDTFIIDASDVEVAIAGGEGGTAERLGGRGGRLGGCWMRSRPQKLLPGVLRSREKRAEPFSARARSGYTRLIGVGGRDK